MSGRALRRLALAAALVPVLVALVTLRTLGRGEAELAESDRALGAGELELSLRHARRAALAYVPGASHVDAAYARLRALALSAERDQDRALAASAWEAMRVAALESGHLWRPRARELAQADDNLARLRGLSAAEWQALRAPEPPRPWAALLLGAGFLVALLGLLAFSAGAWSASGRWRSARATWPALGWCVGMGALAWALLHA
ncbi:MAG TPA: hypothetical protein VFS67_33575 [Polyangiaceae bacterium]|nr:hypothetical protein [Polyangiaceae bacterium]